MGSRVKSRPTRALQPYETGIATPVIYAPRHRLVSLDAAPTYLCAALQQQLRLSSQIGGCATATDRKVAALLRCISVRRPASLHWRITLYQVIHNFARGSSRYLWTFAREIYSWKYVTNHANISSWHEKERMTFEPSFSFSTQSRGSLLSSFGREPLLHVASCPHVLLGQHSGAA